jgi:hypothetical protein
MKILLQNLLITNLKMPLSRTPNLSSKITAVITLLDKDREVLSLETTTKTPTSINRWDTKIRHMPRILSEWTTTWLRLIPIVVAVWITLTKVQTMLATMVGSALSKVRSLLVSQSITTLDLCNSLPLSNNSSSSVSTWIKEAMLLEANNHNFSLSSLIMMTFSASSPIHRNNRVIQIQITRSMVCSE